MKNEVINAANLTFEYPDISVLKNVNFNLYQGDFLGIIGANGAGKSTLIKLILGLLSPDCGDITLFGGTLNDARTKIGYVSQKANSFNSDFPATVKEVVRANLFHEKGLFKPYRKSDDKKVIDALSLVGMAEYKDKLIGSLSGGQQQRVFIARALVGNPQLLLMDEPTVGIDAKSPTLVESSNKLLIFCEHGYEEFVTTSDLSIDRIADILAGKRVHQHV